MLRLTRAGEYAIRGMCYLAQQPTDKLTLIGDIAKEQGCSASFLAKIFQSLSKAGLIDSQRGVSGGVSLACVPEEINLKQIIEAVEGAIALNLCLLPQGRCEYAAQCRMADIWQEAQTRFLDVLERATLRNLQEAYVFGPGWLEDSNEDPNENSDENPNEHSDEGPAQKQGENQEV